MGYFSRLQKDDEPLTPVGRLFSRPEVYQIMNCAVKTSEPIDVQALRVELANSAFTRLPRFTSLFLRHPRTGREFWRKTQIVLDQHIKVIDEELADVNDYLADLAVSCPLPTDKPLWEVHVLTAHNCTVFRVHHSLADGMSLMSLMQSFWSEKTPQEIKSASKNPVVTRKKKSLWELIQMVWYTVIFILEFILTCLWSKDRKTMITGGDGVQLWPRKLATASFTLEDMNIVKKSVLPNATINDVMLGVLSSGLSDYMNLQKPNNATVAGQKIKMVVMVNLRPISGIPEISDLLKAGPNLGWGNKVSFMLHPVYFPKADEPDPLHHLKVAKASMDKKKLSKVAPLSYIVGNLAKTIFGPDFAVWMLYRMACNTTFAFSNVVGPSHEVSMVGKRVTSIKLSVSSVPHAITIHLLSYAGKAEMQILVAKDIIPDPDVLAKCFEDALQRMKKAAITSSEAYEKSLC